MQTVVSPDEAGAAASGQKNRIFADSRSASELTETIRSIARDPGGIERMGDRGRDDVRLHFNRDNHSANLEKLLSNPEPRRAA